MCKLSNENFFPNILTTFLIFPKNAFSRAKIGTRASTGTFTLFNCIITLLAFVLDYIVIYVFVLTLALKL